LDLARLLRSFLEQSIGFDGARHFADLAPIA